MGRKKKEPEPIDDNELPPNIDDYLNIVGINIPIELDSSNEELIHTVMANSGLQYQESKILIVSYFEEIRNGLVQNHSISTNIGNFVVNKNIRFRLIFDLIDDFLNLIRNSYEYFKQ